MDTIIEHLDDGGLWIAAVVSGLVALGWLFRKTWRGYRKLNDFLRKADVILDIAEYELQHNGGGSIKDSVSKIPALREEVERLSNGGIMLAAQLSAHVVQAEGIHEEQAAAIAHLAEALPIVARSTPHHNDALEQVEDAPHHDTNPL